MPEKTCVLLKPDVVKNKNIGAIVSRFEDQNFTICGCKLIQLDDVIIKEHYAHVIHEDFFEDLKNFMKSSPVLALIISGKNAVEEVRKMCGKDYKDAGSIRGEFATCPRQNAIHSSDSKENAEAEISRFFNTSEIFNS